MNRWDQNWLPPQYFTKLSENNYRLQIRTTSAHITDVRRELDPGRTALVIMRGEEGERAGPETPTEDIKGAERMCFSFCSSLCLSSAASTDETEVKNLNFYKKIHNFFMSWAHRTNTIDF